MKKLLPIFSLSFVLFLSACATKGYDGPELSSSQLSKIRFLQEGRVSLKNMSVNGVNKDVMDIVIAVPAGQQTAKADYQLNMSECPMFSAGCFDEVLLGTCNFNFVTHGGHEYTIKFKGSGEQVVSEVIDNSNKQSIANGVCVNQKKDLHMSVTRRRSTIGK